MPPSLRPPSGLPRRRPPRVPGLGLAAAIVASIAIGGITLHASSAAFRGPGSDPAASSGDPLASDVAFASEAASGWPLDPTEWPTPAVTEPWAQNPTLTPSPFQPLPTAAPTLDPRPAPTQTPTKPPPTPKPPSLHLVLGIWRYQPWNPSGLNSLVSTLGRAPNVFMTYEDWTRPFYASDEQEIAHFGAAHVLTWTPFGITLQSIIGGSEDAFIRAYAKGVAAWGGRLYLRPMQEMNGDWFSWGLGVNGNTAAEFVAAWRHMHDIFVQEGATNVKWVWTPNVRYGSNYPFAALYPGSAYVDWVGLDGYNWGLDPHLGNPSWQSFGQIFGASYSQITALAAGKPVMIGEIASTENGGSKAAWILQTFLTDIPKYGAIRCVIWFDQADGASDFRIDSSAASLSAFKEVLNSSLWSGRL